MSPPPATRPPLVVHLDMDSFYVSVERLRDPSLNGKPVIVGGSPGTRGVVCSASYEARAYGVRSAMPAATAHRLCPHAIFVHGDMSNYGEIARQIRAILERFTPLVEMASQDEAYMDMSGTERRWGSPLQTGDAIREAVTGETRLPCSVGIATARHLAKMASDLHKPKGLVWVPAGAEDAFLAPLPVGRMPGVGPATEKRLKELSLRTLGDVQRFGADELERVLGRHGRDLWGRAMGRGSHEVVPESEAKSIGNEVTFAKDSTDRDFLNGVLSSLCEKVAGRMRGEAVRARTITLKFRYTGFETHTASITLPMSIADDGELRRVVRELYDVHVDPTRPMRLLGVTGSNLTAAGGQLDLLEDSEGVAPPPVDRLATALDAVRSRYGPGAIRRGGSTDIRRGSWG